jgi:hypothetical protein
MNATERENLIARRRQMQREMFTLNDRIAARREALRPGDLTDDVELNALLDERRNLMDAMPKASALGLGTYPGMTD